MTNTNTKAEAVDKAAALAETIAEHKRRAADASRTDADRKLSAGIVATLQRKQAERLAEAEAKAEAKAEAERIERLADAESEARADAMTALHNRTAADAAESAAWSAYQAAKAVAAVAAARRVYTDIRHSAAAARHRLAQGGPSRYAKNAQAVAKFDVQAADACEALRKAEAEAASR